LEVGFISPSEAKKKWPGMQFQNAKGILWCPTDGYLQPYDLAMTYKHHARKMGVRFKTNTVVQGIDLSPNYKSGIREVNGVTTNQGKIKCEVIVNAAGAHAYHIAKVTQSHTNFSYFCYRWLDWNFRLFLFVITILLQNLSLTKTIK
jgi:glycine/D-amino acid oxidase-like deaminating enzyme